MKLNEIEKVVNYIEQRDKKNKIGVIVVLVLDIIFILLALLVLKYKIWVFIISIALGILNITFSIVSLKYEKTKETLKERIK